MRVLLFISQLVLIVPLIEAWQADLGNGKYKNPILFSDYSDPDVIRVGSEFYMVSSSFHFMPGIPILQSDDLVNWKIIGHVFPRLDINPAYNLTDGNRYGRGCWAPAIRYHNNRFYVFFPTPDEGIYMSSAPTANGPWELITPVISQSKLEDPCPFWDEDGSAYLIHSIYGAGPLILHKMSPDGKEVLDDGRVVVRDAKNLPVLEGPKLYKRNGYYYIFAPIGGVSGGQQAVLRSRNIYGPYDYKIVLEKGSTLINGPHQGGYVETSSGQGWFLHFQSKGAYGRIVHLEPVKWVDDWPVMGEVDPSDKPQWIWKQPATNAIVGQNAPGPVGQPVLIFKKPDAPRCSIQIPDTGDEFASPVLGMQWQWNHNPVENHWSLTERHGFLRLKALPASDLISARNTLTQMLADPALEAVTLMDVQGMNDHQKAGLCALCQNPSWIGVSQAEGQRHIALFSSNKETLGSAISQKTIQLKVTIVNEMATYSYSLDGSTFTPIGSPAKIVFSWWKGARLGLFTFNTVSGTNQSLGAADFDWFHYNPVATTKSASERAVEKYRTPVGESKAESHPATYAPAGSSRGLDGSNEFHEALGKNGPKAGQRVNRLHCL